MTIAKEMPPLIQRSNIDRKRALFTNGSNSLTTAEVIRSDPDVIVIHNDAGRKVFNCLCETMDDKEKGCERIEAATSYPIYILTMDVVTCGTRYGEWSRHDDMDSLSLHIDTDSFEDDFEAFQSLLLSLPSR